MRNWLCPTDQDRARMLDMSPRVRRARSVTAASCGLGLVALVPYIGWTSLLLFAVVVGNLLTLERRIAASKRPERVIAGTLILTSALLAAGAVLSGGARSPAFVWMILPVAMAAARFRAQVVLVGAGLTGLGMAAVALGVDAGGMLDDPRPVLGGLVLLIGIVALTSALTGAELQYRTASVLDPLTGLLNRNSLGQRFGELREQAVLLGSPICLVVADLDRFKSINDRFGHERGDAVLRDVAYAMRKALRSFELLYRIGGEEFVLVLPGVDTAGGREMAERLRAAVQAARPGNLEVTISLGVAACSGARIEYERLFREADHALYRAKRAGRNRVLAADGQPVRPPTPQAQVA
ncbi:MAG: hypothetical protein NVSMB51_01730 [Solirubrobacteraceae bacterium]